MSMLEPDDYLRKQLVGEAEVAISQLELVLCSVHNNFPIYDTEAADRIRGDIDDMKDNLAELLSYELIDRNDNRKLAHRSSSIRRIDKE